MSWPVRFIVYGCGGVVLAGLVLLAMRGRWDGAGWVVWIPPVTGLLGILFPRALDRLFAQITALVQSIGQLRK